MYMTMTMMRPGLFFQREGPGSEPGNSLLCTAPAALEALQRGAEGSVTQEGRTFSVADT